MRRFTTHVSIIIVLTAFAIPAKAQSDTTFTYQGQLQSAGQPVDSDADFRFRLFDALVGGNQIGSEVAVDAVVVSDGLFDAALDFGADALNGQRWLEIDVRSPHDPGDTEPFTTLDPRQPVTSSTHSIQTRGLTVGDDGNVLFNSMSAVEGTVTMTSIGGIDLILDADTNNSGEDQNARMVLRQDGGQVVGRVGYREGGNQLEIMQEWNSDIVFGTSNLDRMWIRPNGFVGVGRGGPITNAEHFGVHAPVDTGFGGMYVSTEGADAWPFYGYAAGGAVGAYHYYNGSTGTWHFVNGSGTVMTINSMGNVGIGTDAVDTPLVVHSDIAGDTILGLANGLGAAAVVGRSQRGGAGVYGWSTEQTGVNIGVAGQTLSPDGYGVFSHGDFGANGAKFFVQPHPEDPSKEIRFVCLEGNESGTYFRGSTRLVDGRAYIDVPEEFRLVSELDGLTVQVTAMGPNAGLWVESKGLDSIVVVGNGNVEFDYFVNGIRRGFKDIKLIRENHAYMPEIRGVPYGTQYREGHRQILVDNGILNADLTPNEQTAARMGWELRDPKPDELRRATRGALAHK